MCDQDPTNSSCAIRNNVLTTSLIKKHRPRMRAYSPKVRTGCITCKKRRKKCDEEKPICRRCREDQFKCDGYAPISPRKKKPASFIYAPRSREVNQSLQGSDKTLGHYPAHDIPPGAGLTLGLENNGPSGRFFHHFYSITILDFTRIANPKDFWFRRVLPMCYEDPIIRNVVVALGAAHQCYLRDVSKPSPGSANVPRTYFECVAVSFYNKAITELVNIDVETSKSWDIKPRILICCLLFICLENMLGRFDEAVRHMKAACNILKASNLSLVPDQPRQLLQEAATVLLHFNVDASIPPREYDIPNMTLHAAPLRDIDDESQPFMNLAEVKEAMWDLDVKMAYSDWLEYEENWNLTRDDGSLDPEWVKFSTLFGRWKTKFDLLLSSLDGYICLPADAQREIIVLTAQRCMWDIILFPEDNPHNLELRKLWYKMVEVVEDLYAMEASWLGRPVFTLDCDTIPALFHIASYSQDHILIQRVTALLRKFKRREGLWGSLEVADMLEMENGYVKIL